MLSHARRRLQPFDAWYRSEWAGCREGGAERRRGTYSAERSTCYPSTKGQWRYDRVQNVMERRLNLSLGRLRIIAANFARRMSDGSEHNVPFNLRLVIEVCAAHLLQSCDPPYFIFASSICYHSPAGLKTHRSASAWQMKRRNCQTHLVALRLCVETKKRVVN